MRFHEIISISPEMLLNRNAPQRLADTRAVEVAQELPLTVRDAAVYLGVSIQTVYLWVERRQIVTVLPRSERFWPDLSCRDSVGSAGSGLKSKKLA
jgi:excisionase family DNA binding protein